MKAMTVFDMQPRVLAVVTMPPGKKLMEVFDRWFRSEQNTWNVCEEDLTPEEVPILRYNELTIEDEDNDVQELVRFLANFPPLPDIGDVERNNEITQVIQNATDAIKILIKKWE